MGGGAAGNSSGCGGLSGGRPGFVNRASQEDFKAWVCQGLRESKRKGLQAEGTAAGTQVERASMPWVAGREAQKLEWAGEEMQARQPGTFSA